jgi:predicted dehydrogenase
VAITPPPQNTYRAEIEEFGLAILENRAPSPSAELGLRSQRLLAACYESARSGQTLSISTT